MTPEIGLRVLGSGSSGNATIAASGGTALLVEAGLSCRALETRIEGAGRAPDDIAAVLVSHEHGDHCRGAVSFAARHRIPVACTAGTWGHLTARGAAELPEWLPLIPGQPATIGDIRVFPFATPHDASEPVGFRLEVEDAVAVMVTDLGHLSDEVTAAVEGASLLFIESNYDEQQLYESSYPFSTRQRIASTRGHLSNGALAIWLRRHLPASVKTIVLAHLSENTNTPELALEAARSALDAAGRSEVRLIVTSRNPLDEEVTTGPSGVAAAPELHPPAPTIAPSLFAAR